MGLESMMRQLMIQRNEKREKQTKKITDSADPNRVFLKEMVHNFFQSDASAVVHDAKQMLRLLDQLQESMRASPSLLELEAPVTVCGDIHGQMTDLRRIFYICGFPSRARFLFLGDYVDRGAHSVEVVCVLAAMKLLFPQNVFLLRGNHELAHINREYGFHEEIRHKWIDAKDGETVYNKFNECFSYFPLAAVISEKILCMHGGLSPYLNSLDDIRRVRRPIVKPAANSLAQDMLWADPSHSVVGFAHNELRSVSVNFGEREVQERLRKLGVSKIIRAHQVVQHGWETFASGTVITVFSACRYQEESSNYGAVICVKKNLGISVTMIKPSELEENKSNMHDVLTVDVSATNAKPSSTQSSDERHRQESPDDEPPK